jgi:hypothetical protein
VRAVPTAPHPPTVARVPSPHSCTCDDQGVRRHAPVIVLVLAAVSACGSTGGSPAPSPTTATSANDSTRLQDEIKQNLSSQGLTVTDIQCPAGVTPDEGTATTCTGVTAGVSLKLNVTFVADGQILVSAAP